MSEYVDISLDEQYGRLVAALGTGRPISAGRLLGLPELGEDDVWVDVAGAAAIAGVNPRTVTGWLARSGPKRQPFPSPYRLMYRLYWRRSAVEKWLDVSRTD